MTSQSHDLGRNHAALLGLPSSVRRRIYLFLGLARWDGRPLLFDLDGPISPTEQVTFYGLLLSCRAIYNEASALLFSSNRFVIHYRNKRSLQPLRNVTPPSLASLTSLKIVLNQTSCHHRREAEALGKCCTTAAFEGTAPTAAEGYCQRDGENHLHDTPLQSSDLCARLMLDEWRGTAVYLSSNIKPGALQLVLVCDVGQKEVEAAEQAVAPLLLLPELKDCHVRLCSSPNTQLRQLAQNAALQASRKLAPPPASHSTSLLNLPRELRIRILEYTDLVTPWKEVMWNRLEPGYQYLSSGCSSWAGVPCPPSQHHGCQYGRCHGQEIMKDGVVLWDHHQSIGCFCRVQHAAFSSTCKCWAPPTPLFLICRHLCEDARFVFFSANRFVVSDSLASGNPWVAFDILRALDLKSPEQRNDYWESDQYRQAQPPRAYPAHRFAASQFLREVVPAHCLGYLRFLELVFPPYNHECWPHDGHPALQDWMDTLDWAKDRINTPGITLRLTMAGSRLWPPAYPDGREELTQAQGDAVLAGYDRILKPLARLGKHGLTRFYADFAWPWKWTDWVVHRLLDTDDYRATRSWLEGEDKLLSERAERLILGDDQYDRLRSNEDKPEQSPWKMHCVPLY
ncbi:hypothetical protein F5144DRAFT_372159 [Chaetomium tenue]|uniref:Uncharacterized protein n=1 Tax=Chaetomium tenue TaxID=1854479 RepID=A0ACB7NZD1_9PEZI|nr:hypothetical protein F5144DRAFT_372159 [Chaetomium globosum]